MPNFCGWCPADRSYLPISSLARLPRTPSAMKTYLPRSPSPAHTRAGAVGIQPHLAGDDAGDAVAVIDKLRTRHAGEDLDLQRLGLFGQPAADIAHADDICRGSTSAAVSASSGRASPAPPRI